MTTIFEILREAILIATFQHRPRNPACDPAPRRRRNP
tara:strand:- start:1066 stop:1176 length:111 start_codon:yes stop_codon:yes gene_type:complete